MRGYVCIKSCFLVYVVFVCSVFASLRERQIMQLRREGEQWRQIRDVELKEVIGSSGPLGGRAVNRSLLIAACSTECMLRCLYSPYIDVRLCVCLSVRLTWVYVQAHLNVCVCVCWCVLRGVPGTQPSRPLLGLVTTAGLCHPLTAPPSSLT